MSSLTLTDGRRGWNHVSARLKSSWRFYENRHFLERDHIQCCLHSPIPRRSVLSPYLVQKVKIAAMIVQIVSECWIQQLHFPEHCTFNISFVCFSATFLFFRNPLPGKLRRSSFWLIIERPTFDFRDKKDFSVSYCFPAGSVANSSSSQATASGYFTGG